MTYAYLIKKAGEQQSKIDETKTRKIAAIDKQWDKAEEGELPSFNALMDREEGKPVQGFGTPDDPVVPEKITIEFVNKK